LGSFSYQSLAIPIFFSLLSQKSLFKIGKTAVFETKKEENRGSVGNLYFNSNGGERGNFGEIFFGCPKTHYNNNNLTI
jgi:hypothetical protein